MAKVMTDESNYSAIASQIRSKLGVSTRYKPSEMAAAIGSISGVSSSDNGKVVVDGQLTQQTSRSVSQNGTYDTTTNNEVVVNVSGGGGSTNILSGGESPTSQDGSDGAVYLKYYERRELPTGYLPIEYLETNGTQYIDTGIPCNTNNLAVEIEYLPTAGYRSDNGIFGGAWATNGFFLQVANGWKMHDGGSVSTFSASYDDFTILKAVHGEGLYINGVLNQITTTGSNVSNTLKLLGGLSSSKDGHGRIKYAKVWSGETLLLDLVPALNANDTPCMYDYVSEQDFYNEGSGTFGYATAIDGKPITDAYLKVNGSWLPLIGQDIDDVNLGN